MADFMQNISNIQKAENICVQNTNENNISSKCYDNSIKNYKIEIKNILKSYEKMLTKKDYEQLKKSQKEWVKYNNESNSLFENILETDKNPYYCKASFTDKSRRYKHLAESLAYIEFLIYIQKTEKNDD